MNISLLGSEQTSAAPLRLKHFSRDQLKAYFVNSWQLYEWLFSAIIDDDTYQQKPDTLRHPLIFYWGHTAAFYINKLVMAGVLKQGIHSRFEQLFARGVDPDLPKNLEEYDLWPSKTAVDAYRTTVYEKLLEVIETIDIPDIVNHQHPIWALIMGIEHDRIHFETSSVLIRQLREHYLQRPENWKYAPTHCSNADNRMIAVDEGEVEIGKPQDSEIFGWDNEYGYLKQTVDSFEASKNLISNADYLSFYNSGAYQDERYWSEQGWSWKMKTKTCHPKFWVSYPEAFKYRAMFDVLDMPMDYPVEVNAHEAWAYCRWRGKDFRLLTEAEYSLIAFKPLQEKDPAFSNDYNLNMRYGSPTPVGFMNQCQTELGFNDLCGNVWEWIKDDFYPLPGFRPHPLYDDFSMPYFDKDHSMMLGGAWATTGTGASKYYRLWFRRNFYQHAGFRLARSE